MRLRLCRVRRRCDPSIRLVPSRIAHISLINEKALSINLSFSTLPSNSRTVKIPSKASRDACSKALLKAESRQETNSSSFKYFPLSLGRVLTSLISAIALRIDTSQDLVERCSTCCLMRCRSKTLARWQFWI